jgi:hypothetical protein
MTIYRLAKSWVDMGIATVPCHFRGKRPAISSWEPFKERLPTDRELRAWYPTDLHNYAVILGWQRLAVLDFDDMQSWYDWNMWRLDNTTLLDQAYRVKTNRGVHLYFTLLEERDNLKLPGIDFKTHGYTIGPGCTHPTGSKYAELQAERIFPLVESLEQVVPAELLKMAVTANYYLTPCEPVGDVMPAEPLQADLWSLADRAADEINLSAPERIARRWKIEQFFPAREKTGGFWFAVKCPFHQDDNPSAWINVNTQLFGCHSCNMKPMSVIGLFAALHTGGDVKQAVKRMLA